ncbi:MAG: hypothetical protein MUC63_05390, partial [Planctomycetes bacterium]|nr:hypothetical protein [Planctomycetota bacterium]
EWKKEAETGLAEVQAGKLYAEAEKLWGARRFKECGELCGRILSECKESRHFGAMARELKDKADKKGA